MNESSINLARKLDLIGAMWCPKVVAELNDYQIKLVKIEGEFVWHQHDDTDELFVCLKGRVRIELPDTHVDLGEGELYVVPKGVSHRPVAEGECHLMLIEPRGVVNTGDVDSTLTAPGDEWI